MKRVHMEGSAAFTSCGRTVKAGTKQTYVLRDVTCILCRSNESGVTVATLRERDAKRASA